MAYQCSVVGDITLDRFLLLPNLPILPSLDNPGNFVLNLEIGHKIPVSQIIESLGGNAFNTAYGLKRLNIETALISSISNDGLSDHILHIIQSTQINSSYIVQSANSSINQSTILSIDGERIVLSHHQPKDYTQIQIPETEWLYITSLSKGSEELLEKIAFGDKPYRIAFNPGSYLLKNNLPIIQNMLSRTDITFLNKEEAQYITENTKEESIPNLIKLLHDMGVPMVVMTDGNNGAYVGREDSILYIPSIQVPHVAETTGAGDAFAAGFLAGFINSNDLNTALKWGAIQASSVLREIGSVNGLSTLNEVLEIEKTLATQTI